MHLKTTCFVYFLQRLHASHELEGVRARIVSTNIALEGTFRYQDTRSMGEQSKVGIARLVVDGALVLEYEDMLTGKSLNCPGPNVCDLVMKKSQRFDSCQLAAFQNPFDWWS